MADEPGWLIQSIVDGGYSSDGRSVCFKLGCTDGRKTYDLSLYCAADFVPVLMANLTAFAVTARNARLSNTSK